MRMLSARGLHTDARPLNARSATFMFGAHLIATQSASQAVGCAIGASPARAAAATRRCRRGAWLRVRTRARSLGRRRAISREANTQRWV